MKINEFFPKRERTEGPPQGQRDGAPRKQARLNELKKVVLLKTSYMQPQVEEILRLKRQLENPNTSDEEVVHALRTLDCYQMTWDLLVDTQVARAVRMTQRQGRCTDAVNRSVGLVGKWSELVKSTKYRKRSKATGSVM
jgi:hypothetical protein